MLKKIATSAAVLFASGTSLASVEIQFWHAMGGALGETVNEIAGQFNNSQDNYTLTPVFKGSYEETMTAGVSAFRAGEAPHIIQIFDAGAATIINAPGAARAVEDVMESAGRNFDRTAYISGVRSFYADEDGKMIGMPFNSSTPVMYYNKAHLEAAGATPPTTWEDFEAVAKQLKANGHTALAQSHTPWIFFENFHSRHNLQLADAQNGFAGLPSKLMYNNDALTMHLSKVQEWHDAGYYGYFGQSWDDNLDAFVNEEVSMWLGSSGSFGGLNQAADFEFGTTLLPYWASVNENAGNTFIGGAALFAMSGHSTEEEAAIAAFFDFLTQPETQYFWHRETGYVPVTNAAYELAKSEGYYVENPDAEVGVQQLSLPGGEWAKGYRLGLYVQTREVIYREMDKLMAGDTTPERALREIEKAGNQNLKRFARTVN